jgi:hypothetical protein
MDEQRNTLLAGFPSLKMLMAAAEANTIESPWPLLRIGNGSIAVREEVTTVNRLIARVAIGTRMHNCSILRPTFRLSSQSLNHASSTKTNAITYQTVPPTSGAV